MVDSKRFFDSTKIKKVTALLVTFFALIPVLKKANLTLLFY